MAQGDLPPLDDNMPMYVSDYFEPQGDGMGTRREELNHEIRLLRTVTAAMEKLNAMGISNKVDEDLDVYREWLQEAIAEREAL